MRMSVAVVTVPSVPTAMGRMVGITTFILVAAGSPSRVPSGAAGDIHRGGFGSGCANGETCHKADGEEQGYEFLHVLHSEFSFFVLLVLDGNMDVGPGNTKRCAGVRI